jgi:hypothetical protein
MRRLHLIVGVLLLVAFILTGQYMDKVHAHLIDMAVGPRMLYRTRHIFILLTSLIHLGLGTYVRPRAERWRRVLQWTGSLLLVVAGGFFIQGFIYEPSLASLSTPFSHRAAYVVVAGMLLHALPGGLKGRARD